MPLPVRPAVIAAAAAIAPAVVAAAAAVVAAAADAAVVAAAVVAAAAAVAAVATVTAAVDLVIAGAIVAAAAVATTTISIKRRNRTRVLNSTYVLINVQYRSKHHRFHVCFEVKRICMYGPARRLITVPTKCSPKFKAWRYFGLSSAWPEITAFTRANAIILALVA